MPASWPTPESEAAASGCHGDRPSAEHRGKPAAGAVKPRAFRRSLPRGQKTAGTRPSPRTEPRPPPVTGRRPGGSARRGRRGGDAGERAARPLSEHEAEEGQTAIRGGSATRPQGAWAVRLTVWVPVLDRGVPEKGSPEAEVPELPAPPLPSSRLGVRLLRALLGYSRPGERPVLSSAEEAPLGRETLSPGSSPRVRKPTPPLSCPEADRSSSFPSRPQTSPRPDKR
jgi:hypothetical protein